MFLADQDLDAKFEIKPLTLASKNEALKLMKDHYQKDSLFQYIPEIKQSDFVDYENARFDISLKENYSLGIFEKKSGSTLIAFALNHIAKKEEKSSCDGNFGLNHATHCGALQAYKRFFNELSASTFDILKTDEVFFAGSATVHSDYRNLGLFNVLQKCCVYLGLKSGCEYLIGRPTSEYVIKVAMAAGYYRCIKKVNFIDYIDPVSGLRLFANAKFPHVRAQILCVNLKEMSSKPYFNLSKL